MEELEYRWARETYTPADFADKFSLPRAARLLSASSSAPGGGVSAPPAGCLGEVLDVSSPVLVYSQRRRTKGYGRHLVWEARTGVYVPEDVMVEIPKDYAGFFEIVPTDPRHRPVHHPSIRSVAASRCKRFLVRTVLGGFRTSQDDNGEVTLLAKHMLYPGEVLRRVRTVTKRWRLQEGAQEEEEGGGRRKAETKYLLCTDLTGQEVCLPMAHPGTFCALYDADTDSKHFVWKADDILTHFRLPVTVRLVFGWPPKLPAGSSPFSGVLQILEKRRPDTLVLCSLVEKTSVVGELPLDMSLRLQPARNQQDLATSQAYRAATKRCDRGAYCYVISMKALDVDYRHLLTALRVSTVGRRSAVSYGMLASALDMWAFNIRDIFPPIDEKQFTSSLPITFRDPLDDDQGQGDLPREEEEEDEEVTSGSDRKSNLKRSKSLSGLNKRDALLDDLAADLEPSLTDARRSRVEDADNREAQC